MDGGATVWTRDYGVSENSATVFLETMWVSIMTRPGYSTWCTGGLGLNVWMCFPCEPKYREAETDETHVQDRDNNLWHLTSSIISIMHQSLLEDWHYVTARTYVCVCACACVHMCVLWNIMIMITKDFSDVRKTEAEKNDLLFLQEAGWGGMIWSDCWRGRQKYWWDEVKSKWVHQ